MVTRTPANYEDIYGNAGNLPERRAADPHEYNRAQGALVDSTRHRTSTVIGEAPDALATQADIHAAQSRQTRRAFLRGGLVLAGAAAGSLAYFTWESWDNASENAIQSNLDTFGRELSQEMLQTYHVVDADNQDDTLAFEQVLNNATQVATKSTLNERESVRMKNMSVQEAAPIRRAAYVTYFYQELERGIRSKRDRASFRPINPLQAEMDNLRGATDDQDRLYVTWSELGPEIHTRQLESIRQMLTLRVDLYLARRNPHVDIDKTVLQNKLASMSEGEMRKEGRDDVSLKDFIERIIIPLA